jgi:hypothetical protein
MASVTASCAPGAAGSTIEEDNSTIEEDKMSNLMRSSVAFFRTAIALAAVVLAGSTFAGTGQAQNPTQGSDRGGHVLSARAEPHGFSLVEIAKATAAFNVTDHSGTPPSIPCQMLYTTPTNSFDVPAGTMLYVPVLQNDDSPPVIGTFPDFSNREALLQYFYSQKQLGVQYTTLTIDGKETSLGGDYLVGVTVPPLPDGGGTHYMVVAAFVSPLPAGRHVVSISALVTGAALVPWCQIVGFCTTQFGFTTEYSVNVH